MSAFPPAWRRPTRHACAALIVWLYAGVLVVGAAHHHHLTAQSKSSAHCTICQVISFVRPQAPPQLVPASLTPSGHVVAEPETRWVAAPGRVVAGRSPPVC